MEKLPIVSIIINNYNYAHYLPEAVNSALSQSYPNIEIIVVDDGSTDESKDVIRSYEDRVKAIYKSNGGQASALNIGFANCHGELIFFLDADDLLLPTAVQKVVDEYKAKPVAAKFQYHMAVLNAQGAATGEIKPSPHLRLPSGDLRKQEMTFPFDLPWLPTSGNAFSARVLREILPIPEKEYGFIFADYYLCHIAPLYGHVVSLDQVLAGYRIHGKNWYQQQNPRLNLGHIRRTIEICELTACYLNYHAKRLGLSIPSDPTQSVSVIAQRLISLKLDPEHHPFSSDRPIALMIKGWKASLRRSDIHLAMKWIFGAWFIAEAVATRKVGEKLAEMFLYPEKRTGMNELFRSLHRGGFLPDISQKSGENSPQRSRR